MHMFAVHFFFFLGLWITVNSRDEKKLLVVQVEKSVLVRVMARPAIISMA